MELPEVFPALKSQEDYTALSDYLSRSGSLALLKDEVLLVGVEAINAEALKKFVHGEASQQTKEVELNGRA